MENEKLKQKNKDVKKIALTFKCDLKCQHCYVDCSPDNKISMDTTNLVNSLHNFAPYTHRIWLSGCEPTTRMGLLDVALQTCKSIKKNTGYPKEIIIQTNGFWSKDLNKREYYLKYFYDNGVTGIDISSNDLFHFAQMKSKTIPSELYQVALKSGLFQTVNISGSPLNGLKILGRYKKLIKTFPENYDVFCCEWAKTKSLGKSYEKSILEIINDEKNNFKKLNQIKY